MTGYTNSTLKNDKRKIKAQIQAKALRVTNVMVVTKNIKHSPVEDKHLIPNSSLEEAPDISFRLVSAESKISTVKDRSYVTLLLPKL